MKKLWIDTETLGLTPGKYSLVQIAAIFDYGNDRHDFNMTAQTNRPFKAQVLALATNNYHEKDTSLMVEPQKLAWEFLRFLIKCRELNGGFKLTIAGHNPRFDLDHIKAFYEQNVFGLDGIEDFFDYHILDTVTVAKTLQEINLLEYKQRLSLSALCERFNISQVSAHDAMSDVKAARELFYKMINLIKETR